MVSRAGKSAVLGGCSRCAGADLERMVKLDWTECLEQIKCEGEKEYGKSTRQMPYVWRKSSMEIS